MERKTYRHCLAAPQRIKRDNQPILSSAAQSFVESPAVHSSLGSLIHQATMRIMPIVASLFTAVYTLSARRHPESIPRKKTRQLGLDRTGQLAVEIRATIWASHAGCTNCSNEWDAQRGRMQQLCAQKSIAVRAEVERSAHYFSV